MVRFSQNKDSWKRTMYSWPMLIFVTGIALWAGIQVFRSWQSFRAVKHDQELLQKEINQLARDTKNLEEQKKLLESATGMERAIRERLNVQKEGEKVIIFVNEAHSVSPESEQGFFGSIGQWFKKIFSF